MSNTRASQRAETLIACVGLRDINSARVKITERYLLDCDEIFAVCNIGRATTDAGVKSVFDLARRVSLSQVGIICTKSDVSRESFHCRHPSQRYFLVCDTFD